MLSELLDQRIFRLKLPKEEISKPDSVKLRYKSINSHALRNNFHPESGTFCKVPVKYYLESEAFCKLMDVKVCNSGGIQIQQNIASQHQSINQTMKHVFEPQIKCEPIMEKHTHHTE